MGIYSIVRIVKPGFVSSYPIGRFEVYHTDSESVASSLVGTFNRCRYDLRDDRLLYSVEYVEELSPQRAPPAGRANPESVCTPNVRFV